ncbi:hypothetical protein SCA6_011454 [Theobroma cacao]
MEEGKEKKRLNQGEGEGENGWGREERRDEKEERRDSRERYWDVIAIFGVALPRPASAAMAVEEQWKTRKAMIMGLMLHANTKNNIMRQLHKDALEVLTTGEFVDNVPILQITMVWCNFLLRNISWLSVAGIHLDKASEGLKHCHGKDLSCVKLLQAGRLPELSLHMRLELLEEVVAYHNGQFDESRKILTGYARRALQLNNQDIGNAVDFPCEERQ